MWIPLAFLAIFSVQSRWRRCSAHLLKYTPNTMKTAIFATLLASAGAFAPSSTGRVNTKLFEDAVAEAVEEAPAAPVYEASKSLPFLEQPPNLKGYVGDVGFDPFRFSDFLPVDFLREAELKHGRICMLATVGWVAVESGLRIYPTPEAYEGLTTITAHDALVKYGAMQQMFMWIGLSEVFGSIAVIQMLQGSGRQPGDFGFDPAGFLKNASPAKADEMKLKELKNGRLAMLAFSGIVTQAVLSQGTFPYL